MPTCNATPNTCRLPIHAKGLCEYHHDEKAAAADTARLKAMPPTTESIGQYINRERAAFLRKPAAPTALEEAQADARELMDDARREMAEEDYDRS